MIHYNHGGMWIIYNIFTTKGSVFPQSLMVAVPCGLLTAAVKLFAMEVGWEDMQSRGLLNNNAAWSGFSFLVGFLIVFRTSQAYNRFWDGCIWTHQMRAEWFDACSSVCAFCKHSTADAEQIQEFKELIVRLFSMLHAAALGEIEDSAKSELNDIAAFHMELIDPEGIDNTSMASLMFSDSKAELIFQWIQQLIIESTLNGVLSVPPPILSRSFQEIASGMIAFHQALKISYIPFPFPYAQVCDCLLIMHGLVAPLVCALWASNPGWAGLFCAIQVFILWALNFIAVEIENPFGMDENDLDGVHMQSELNRHLSLLLQAESGRTPRMKTKEERDKESQAFRSKSMQKRSKSFVQVWTDLEESSTCEPFFAARARSSRNSAQQRRAESREARRSINESMAAFNAESFMAGIASMDADASDRTSDMMAADSELVEHDSQQSFKEERQVSSDTPRSEHTSENGSARAASSPGNGLTNDIAASQKNQVRLNEHEARLRHEHHVLDRSPSPRSPLSLSNNDNALRSVSSGMNHIIGLGEIKVSETGDMEGGGMPPEMLGYHVRNVDMPIETDPQSVPVSPRKLASLRLANPLKPEPGIEQL